MNYRIGIIGAGAIVESGHLPAILSLGNTSVEWIFDINSTRSDLLSRMYKVKSIGHNELENAIAGADVCALTIPYGVRKEYIEVIAKAGKALYVEKPFALTLAEHEQYCQLFPKNKLAVGYQRRCYRFVGLFRSVIQSRIFGQLKSITFNQGYFSLKGGKGYLSDAKLSGGGVIIESAIHTLDQLLVVTDATDIEVVSVDSFCRNRIDYDTSFSSILKRDADTIHVKCNISALRNLDNGVEFEFETAIIKAGAEPDPRLYVYDTKGNLVDVDLHSSISSAEEFSARNVNMAFVLFWKRFLDGIENKEINITSAETSFLTTKWVDQIYNKLNQE